VPVVTLKGRMEQLKVPGISVAVFSEGRIEWTRAYGYADRERGIAATPHTLFEAGSISKALAALAALQLVERGSLDLDGRIRVGWEPASWSERRSQRSQLPLHARRVSRWRRPAQGGRSGPASWCRGPICDLSCTYVNFRFRPQNRSFTGLESLPGAAGGNSGSWPRRLPSAAVNHHARRCHRFRT